MKNIVDELDEPSSTTRIRSGFDQPAPDTALATNIAKLETDLSTEKEERCEERFIWISVVFALLMTIIYISTQSLPVFFMLFLLGLILLIGIANRLGVDWAVQGVGWLMHWISNRARISPDKEEQ
ncbi:MAG: hypothetical protein KK482_07980 [Sinorhizobium meliloti]|nr:hypothetical protein [Sinorhizobium meliloti]